MGWGHFTSLLVVLERLVMSWIPQSPGTRHRVRAISIHRRDVRKCLDRFDFCSQMWQRPKPRAWHTPKVSPRVLKISTLGRLLNNSIFSRGGREAVKIHQRRCEAESTFEGEERGERPNKASNEAPFATHIRVSDTTFGDASLIRDYEIFRGILMPSRTVERDAETSHHLGSPHAELYQPAPVEKLTDFSKNEVGGGCGEGPLVTSGVPNCLPSSDLNNTLPMNEKGRSSAGEMNHRTVVIGIDFGTTFSGTYVQSACGECRCLFSFDKNLAFGYRP
jgi:hypothetical protein